MSVANSSAGCRRSPGSPKALIDINTTNRIIRSVATIATGSEGEGTPQLAGARVDEACAPPSKARRTGRSLPRHQSGGGTLPLAEGSGCHQQQPCNNRWRRGGCFGGSGQSKKSGHTQGRLPKKASGRVNTRYPVFSVLSFTSDGRNLLEGW